MEASELRLGNKILNDCIINTVSEISNAGHIFTEESGFVNLEHHIEPIILEPEILEACGFEKDTENDRYIVKKDVYFLEPGFTLTYGKSYPDFWLFGFFHPCIATSAKPIESLHQLQNLYFALTGKELYVNIAQQKTAL